MVIGLINQAVYLCDRKFKEGDIMKKENGKWNNRTNISIIIFVLVFIGVTNMDASGFLGIGDSAS
jgi:hypothetical protein